MKVYKLRVDFKNETYCEFCVTEYLFTQETYEYTPYGDSYPVHLNISEIVAVYLMEEFEVEDEQAEETND